MRPILFCLPLAFAGAFLIGRTTGPGAASAESTGRIYTGGVGDVFRVSAAATRCLVSSEAGAVNVHCSHLPLARARYEVVFYRDNLFVYRSGNPDDPVFSAKGKP
jgi:hypothetical protein